MPPAEPSSPILSDLYVYPVKSCAGIRMGTAVLGQTGLHFDRDWMVVDARGEFLSQRECPRLALVKTELRHSELVLRAPGMIALHLRLDGAESETRVQVWDDELPAFDMGGLAGQWFSDFLGIKGLRLAAFDSDQKRVSDAAWSGGVEALNAFSDGFPLLVLSTASLAELNRRLAQAGHPAVGMERFRPNLVLDGLPDAHAEDSIDTLRLSTADGPVVLKLTKPCPRCPIPDIDPTTAEKGSAVGEALQGYRGHPRLNGAIAFGMNAVIVEGVGRTLATGAPVEVGWAV